MSLYENVLIDYGLTNILTDINCMYLLVDKNRSEAFSYGNCTNDDFFQHSNLCTLFLVGSIESDVEEIQNKLKCQIDAKRG